MASTATPLLTLSPSAASPNYTSLISALSNVSIQYNLSVIAVALLIMDPSTDDDTDLSALYPRTSTFDQWLRSSVFAGAIVGQAIMGGLGDILGRGPAMILTNSFTFLGAVLCAAASWGDSDDVYGALIGYRFLMGIGIGGKYPLASTIRAEGTSSGEHRATEVAKGFFWQTPGVIAPYLLGWILVASFGSEKNGVDYRDVTELQFRILFGVGALPSGLVIILTWLQFRGKERERVGSENPVRVALNHPELWRKLIGTGGCWFMYDFVYYGTALNQTSIINNVFGGDETIYDNCWHNIVVAAMGIPGVLTAIYQLEAYGDKRLMSWGFVLIGFTSLLLCASFKYYPDNNSLNFALFCLLLFAVNWGCNVATYVLPIETFPAEVRSSFYGLSAALGKVGAFLGGFFFEPISKGAGGYSSVYGVCFLMSLAGVAFSGAFIEPFNKGVLFKSKEEEEEEEDDEDVREVKRELNLNV